MKIQLEFNCLDAQVEVTCLAFNPLVNKLLLVGTGHGQLNLYTTGRGNLPIFFQSLI